MLECKTGPLVSSSKRRGRKGAFREDRYHSTEVDIEGYLARCMTYINLSVVRDGTVIHPSERDGNKREPECYEA